MVSQFDGVHELVLAVVAVVVADAVVERTDVRVLYDCHSVVVYHVVMVEGVFLFRSCVLLSLRRWFYCKQKSIFTITFILNRDR